MTAPRRYKQVSLREEILNLLHSPKPSQLNEGVLLIQTEQIQRLNGDKQLKPASSHIIILSALQLFLLYYERTNENSPSWQAHCLTVWHQSSGFRWKLKPDSCSEGDCKALLWISLSMCCLNMYERFNDRKVFIPAQREKRGKNQPHYTLIKFTSVVDFPPLCSCCIFMRVWARTHPQKTGRW